MDDKLYDAYKQWWDANYENLNKKDENPVKLTDAPAADSSSSATQSSGKMPRLTDLDAEQKEQKRQKKVGRGADRLRDTAHDHAGDHH